MAAAVTVTPSTPQAGFTVATVAGTGFSASTVLSLLVKYPNHGSNWTTPDGTNLTQGRREQYVTTDGSGAFSVLMMFPYDIGSTFTIETRPVTEQYIVTTPITSTTVVPTQANN